MTSRDFAYWLQGFFELSRLAPESGEAAFGPKQVACIEAHLAMVFAHEIDPAVGDAKKQEVLKALHEHGLPARGYMPPDTKIMC